MICFTYFSGLDGPAKEVAQEEKEEKKPETVKEIIKKEVRLYHNHVGGGGGRASYNFLLSRIIGYYCRSEGFFKIFLLPFDVSSTVVLHRILALRIILIICPDIG